MAFWGFCSQIFLIPLIHWLWTRNVFVSHDFFPSLQGHQCSPFVIIGWRCHFNWLHGVVVYTAQVSRWAVANVASKLLLLMSLLLLKNERCHTVNKPCWPSQLFWACTFMSTCKVTHRLRTTLYWLIHISVTDKNVQLVQFSFKAAQVWRSFCLFCLHSVIVMFYINGFFLGAGEQKLLSIIPVSLPQIKR